MNEKYTPPNHGKSINEQKWDLLDETVAKLKNPNLTDPIEKARLQGRAGGIADTLVYSGGPWFTDRKAVTKEAVKRYKIAKGLIPFEPTPGYHYNPPPPGTAYPTSKIIRTAPQSKQSKKKPETALSGDVIKKLKIALAANMPAEALAHAYKVTVQQVLSCK